MTRIQNSLDAHTKGFTLVEIVIVVALLFILMAITLLSFSDIGDNNALETSVASVVGELNEARSKTLASEGDERYGVHLGTTQIVQFAGSSYTSGDASNVVTDIHASAEIADIDLSGGGTDIIFNRLTGETNQYGTFVIRLQDDVTASTTVTIYQTGIIETN